MLPRVLRFVVPLAFALTAQPLAQEPAAPPPKVSPPKVPQPATKDPAGPVPDVLLEGFDWRLIGPFRGGRVAAVTGVVGDRDTYYFGGTGGGVWKSSDAGGTWQSLSDGTFGGSIGAVAVAPSDPKILYVGGGEETWRGNVSSGDGMWKSTDGGKSWAFVGLPDSRHISRIRIDPKNPDLVYAAVMGHLSGPNQQRGVFRSKDGGSTWQRVLFVSAEVGAVDLCFAPDDANVLYATTWRAVRTPWSLESGGEGSGLWKSIDGGETWLPLSGKKGLPKGTLGISGIAASPAQPKRVYAQIEAEHGGLFRSEDGGETWKRVNSDRSLRQRAWYYTRVYADPKNADTVYVVNVQFHKSTDGGVTFTTIRTPHGDNHDLWIDPDDPKRMIEGNDGGACVSNDGGATWSSLDNQPTAQFYRVTTDDAKPYRIYGAQQDNSTVRIRSRSRGRGIGRDDWEPTAGGESGWLAPKPGNSDIVFGGNYGGSLQRLDHETGLSRNVNVWPDNPMGAGVGEQRYRFQWNFPILFSRHDPNVLYTSAQVLFKSTDEGQTWEPISGDLTRNDHTKMGPSGGPITKDNTGVEYYGTIFTVDEGRAPGTIWCGSDDGLVHVTQDGGKTWKNVTPPQAPEWLQINCIATSPFVDGGCYVAATRYKLDDFRPYLYATDDYGSTWREISGGLDPGWFTRCIRPDPVVQGLLYCGTERTVWMSFDDGRRWQRLQKNLPTVPITDLAVRGGELIAATQGRAFWSFDHLPHVRQLSAELAVQPLHVFTPVPVALYPGSDEQVPGLGRNPAKDLRVSFFIGGNVETPVTDRVSIEVKDFDGKVVFTRSTPVEDTAEKAAGTAGEAKGEAKAETKAEAEPDEGEAKPVARKGDDDGEDGAPAADGDKPEEPLAVKRGMNSVTITWKPVAPKILDGMILWNGRGRGPRPAPGDYTITVTMGETSQHVVGRIEPDPRTEASIDDLQARYRLVREACDVVTEAHDAIAKIRSLRKQMQTVVEHCEGEAKAALEAEQKRVDGALTAVEEALYQTRSKSNQDPLNFPIRLTDKLLGVISAVDGAEFAPTAGQRDVAAKLIEGIRAELARFGEAKKERVAEFNRLARELAVPHVK